MIAQNYYTKDIPLSLRDLIKVYNSACPSMSNYDECSHIPYLLNSTILMEVLLKRILFKLNGRYRGVHNLKLLVESFGSFGIRLRKFSKKELDFLDIDHSTVRYNFDIYLGLILDESMIDNLFEYFIDLAIKLKVE